MNALADALRLALSDLRDTGTACALVGGLAVSARTELRFTRYVDLAVAVADDRGAEDVVRQLVAGGYRVVAQVEHAETGRLATMRLSPPGASGLIVDLLFASSGIEGEIVAEAEPLSLIADVVAPVAGIPHLLAMKLLSVDPGRPQDGADIAALARSISATGVARCRELLHLIESRGYARGRSLTPALEDALRGHG